MQTRKERLQRGCALLPHYQGLAAGRQQHNQRPLQRKLRIEGNVAAPAGEHSQNSSVCCDASIRQYSDNSFGGVESVIETSCDSAGVIPELFVGQRFFADLKRWMARIGEQGTEKATDQASRLLRRSHQSALCS